MQETNALLEALRKNDLAAAKQLLEQGEKLPKDLPSYQQSQYYDTLVRAQAYDVIDLFVKARTIETDLYEYDKFDNSIFESLFRNAKNEPADRAFLPTFLGKLDNINEPVNDQPLLGFAFSKQVPMDYVRILVEAGCNVHYKNNYEENYLYKIVQEYAIKEDLGVQYLEYLMQEGLEPAAGNIVRTTPLHQAVSLNKKSYIDLFLQHGADLNQPGKDGETAFYIALVHQCCNVATYNKLAEHTLPDFDIRNKNEEDIFGGVARMSNSPDAKVQVIKALIRDGADVYQTSPSYQKDKAVLDWFCEQDAGILEGVLETGVVELDRRDNQGNTLLHKVCAYNVNYDQEAAKQLYRKVKLLLEKGADPHITNDQDQLPMDLAAQDNLKSRTVELLLKHKA